MLKSCFLTQRLTSKQEVLHFQTEEIFQHVRKFWQFLRATTVIKSRLNALLKSIVIMNLSSMMSYRHIIQLHFISTSKNRQRSTRVKKIKGLVKLLWLIKHSQLNSELLDRGCSRASPDAKLTAVSQYFYKRFL